MKSQSLLLNQLLLHFKIDFMNNFFSEKNVSVHETWVRTIRGARTKWAHLCSLFVIALLVNFSNPVAAQITVDGNPIEWGTGAVTGLPSFTYIANPFGNGVVDNQFTEGSKDFLLAADLIWSIGQTKAKNDLANGAALILNGNLYFAGDRTSNNGDAQIGFWFYLNGTGPVIQPDGTHNFAHHIQLVICLFLQTLPVVVETPW